MPDSQNEITVLITGSIILFLVLVSLLIFIFVFSYKSKVSYKQTLLQSQLEIQEQTLQHLSKELHDNLGQVASLIKINLFTIGLDNKDKAIQKLNDTRELTKQLITDIKALSVSLGADRITQTGLAKALETEIDRLNKTEQFKATFVLHGILPNVHNDTAIILYRMAQEVLNNMVKHSNAQHITFKLSFIDNLIILAISDDGKGFDINEQMKNGNGAGLHNLQKRATLINATLTMESSIGNGTQVTIELPYSYDPNNTKTEISPG